MRSNMKKIIVAMVTAISMFGLVACGGNKSADSEVSKMSREDFASIYAELGVQEIDEFTEGVTFADPAWKIKSGEEDGTLERVYVELSGKSVDSLDYYYYALYGMGFELDEANPKKEAYCEYLLEQGYEEKVLDEDVYVPWDNTFVKENVGIIGISYGGNILSDEGVEDSLDGQVCFRVDILLIK